MNQNSLTGVENRRERQLAVVLRRCLKCAHWMRSTGAGHRICNPCRLCDRDFAPFRRAGERVMPSGVDGRVRKGPSDGAGA